MLMSATSITPITREAGRIDAVNTVCQMLGEMMTMSTTMTLTTTPSTLWLGLQRTEGCPQGMMGTALPCRNG